MALPMTSSSTLNGRGGQLAAATLQNRYLSFGQFQVDLQREELIKDGLRMRVPSKVYQVLMALLEKPGEVVTREALRIRLWPEGTYVNYDANVNTTVNKLRLVLGDSPDQPVFVDTIPRKGYSFVAAVEYVESLGWEDITAWERSLGERFLAGLPPSIRLHGLAGMDGRVPTFAFSVDGVSAGEAAARLGERGFAVWHGNYYALEVMKRLGLEDDGGAVRVGFVHYNTADEVDRLLAELARLE